MNTKIILDFLGELSLNNNKNWFDANKSTYELVKKEFCNIVNMFIENIALFDKSLEGLLPKQCMFRINRDIRFSNDKTPYKNWLSAYISQGGRKSCKAGYYIHLQNYAVDPTAGSRRVNSFIAGGLHLPTSEILTNVRQSIAENGDKLSEIINSKLFKLSWGEFLGESLKKAPRDFSTEDKYIDLIKLKSFDLVHEYPNEEVINAQAFFEDALNNFRLLKPVNDFFNKACNGLY